MSNESDNSHDHSSEEGPELGLDIQTQIFLELRGQNLELLKIASQVAGYGAGHGPLKSSDLKTAVRGIWDVYSEFYNWVDPEEAEGDEE